ncbi:MAG: recombinase family protein [Rhodocyclaceae bacterium]|nr:recombinase family protein [Rhodocyclaceae bacterium]
MQIALYARVSTSRQADNDLSIPDQLRQLNEWGRANGHLVVHEYVEPGASATDDKRDLSTDDCGCDDETSSVRSHHHS